MILLLLGFFIRKKVVSWSVHSSLSSFLYSLNQVPCALKITLSQYSDFIKSFTLNLYSHFQTLMIKSHVTSFKFKFVWIMHGGKSNVLTLEFKVNFKSNLFHVFYAMMHVELYGNGTKKSRNLVKIGIWVIFMSHILMHIICNIASACQNTIMTIYHYYFTLTIGSFLGYSRNHKYFLKILIR